MSCLLARTAIGNQHAILLEALTDLINPSPSPTDDGFGERLDIEDGQLLVGAQFDSDIASGSGAVHAYSSATVSILEPPSDQSAAQGGAASFDVVATGQSPLSFRWKVGGVAVPQGMTPYQGSTTERLTITTAAASLPGAITVEVTDACGFGVTSPAASLNVTTSLPACSGDANADGIVRFDDITAVLISFGTSCR